TGSSVSRAAAIAGRAAFFAPLMRIVPRSGFPPRITNLSIAKEFRNETAASRTPILFHFISEKARFPGLKGHTGYESLVRIISLLGTDIAWTRNFHGLIALPIRRGRRHFKAGGLAQGCVQIKINSIFYFNQAMHRLGPFSGRRIS